MSSVLWLRLVAPTCRSWTGGRHHAAEDSPPLPLPTSRHHTCYPAQLPFPPQKFRPPGGSLSTYRSSPPVPPPQRTGCYPACYHPQQPSSPSALSTPPPFLPSLPNPPKFPKTFGNRWGYPDLSSASSDPSAPLLLVTFPFTQGGCYVGPSRISSNTSGDGWVTLISPPHSRIAPPPHTPPQLRLKARVCIGERTLVTGLVDGGLALRGS